MRSRLFIVILFLGHIASGQGAKPVRIPGTNCSLAPPPGFILYKEKSGFIDSGAAASIVVDEVQMPYDTLIAEFSEKNFREHDGELLSKEVVTGKGSHAVLLIARQTLHSNKYKTLLLLSGDNTSTVIVAGNYPEGSTALEPSMKAAILSMVYHKPPPGKAKGK